MHATATTESVGPRTPVRQLIRRPAVFVRSALTLRQAAEVLDGDTVGVALVRADGRFAGLLSERDIVRALADGADPDGERVEDVMTVEMATVAPDTTISDVANLMLANDIRHTPITEGDAAIGLVSQRDVLAVLLSAGDKADR